MNLESSADSIVRQALAEMSERYTAPGSRLEPCQPMRHVSGTERAVAGASPPHQVHTHPMDTRSTSVLIVRHAPSTWNVARRKQGWADPPLTPQAERAARDWARTVPRCLAAVAASDLQRASATAAMTAANLALSDVHKYPGLREQHQGDWTGLTKPQIKRLWPELLRERPRRPAGGETPDQVLTRVLDSLLEFGKAHRGRCVLVVTHNHVIQTVERALHVETAPSPHLEGRWLHLCHDVPSTQPALAAFRAGAPTGGRPPNSKTPPAAEAGR